MSGIETFTSFTNDLSNSTSYSLVNGIIIFSILSAQLLLLNAIFPSLINFSACITSSVFCQVYITSSYKKTRLLPDLFSVNATGSPPIFTMHEISNWLFLAATLNTGDRNSSLSSISTKLAVFNFFDGCKINTNGLLHCSSNIFRSLG